MQSSRLYSSIWSSSACSPVCIHCSKMTIEVPPSFTSAWRSKSRNASISFSP